MSRTISIINIIKTTIGIHFNGRDLIGITNITKYKDWTHTCTCIMSYSILSISKWTRSTPVLTRNCIICNKVTSTCNVLIIKIYISVFSLVFSCTNKILTHSLKSTNILRSSQIRIWAVLPTLKNRSTATWGYIAKIIWRALLIRSRIVDRYWSTRKRINCRIYLACSIIAYRARVTIRGSVTNISRSKISYVKNLRVWVRQTCSHRR